MTVATIIKHNITVNGRVWRASNRLLRLSPGSKDSIPARTAFEVSELPVALNKAASNASSYVDVVMATSEFIAMKRLNENNHTKRTAMMFVLLNIHMPNSKRV